ncbi:hypothetical protein ABE096_13850 [Robertmurraya massiliosenegalensis]|uniref:hypothetical protein n=1 Tax=Robertmurraya TaxID=2837507 RepID=UPI0039A75941
MTINTTVFVPEGIVIASDSRLTGTRRNNRGYDEQFILSDNMNKILLLKGNRIGIAFNGDTDFMGKSIHQILQEFVFNHSEQTDNIRDISMKLQYYVFSNYPGMDVNFIVAGYENGEPYVFQVTEAITQRLNVDSEDNIIFGVISYGNIDFVKMLNSKSDIEFEFMPLKDAVEFAEFYEESTIKWLKFNNGYSDCGGPIDILVITPEQEFFYKNKL